MSLDITIPKIATTIDWSYQQSIPAGTAVGKYTIKEEHLPPNTMGQLVEIENQGANADNIAPYVLLNDVYVPRSFTTNQRPYLKENRSYYILEWTQGGDKLTIGYNLNTIPLANTVARVKVLFWYVDIALMEHFKDEPDVSLYYKMVQYFRGKK